MRQVKYRMMMRDWQKFTTNWIIGMIQSGLTLPTKCTRLTNSPQQEQVR